MVKAKKIPDVHNGHRAIESENSSIVFKNVKLPDYIEEQEEIDLDNLIEFVKVIIDDEKDEEAGCREAIPIMQFLHNIGIRVFDYDLATFYLAGEIIEKDCPLAIELLKGVSSAPYNDAMSMTKLGDCYQYGYGTPINAAEAMKWYEDGAIHGDEYAALNAGVLYARGFREVKPNHKKAKFYLRRIKDNKDFKRIAKDWLKHIKIGDTPDYSF